MLIQIPVFWIPSRFLLHAGDRLLDKMVQIIAVKYAFVADLLVDFDDFWL